MATRVVIVFDNIPVVAQRLHGAVAKLVKTAAFNVETRAKNHATVDTGAMKSAIYTVTREGSWRGGDPGGYESATAEALSLNPKAEMQDEEPRPERDTLAIVHAGMNYSVYVEYGTGKMAAKPFMAPAAAEEQPRLQQALGVLARELSV
jgi:hypothetical protein